MSGKPQPSAGLIAVDERGFQLDDEEIAEVYVRCGHSEIGAARELHVDRKVIRAAVQKVRPYESRRHDWSDGSDHRLLDAIEGVAANVEASLARVRHMMQRHRDGYRQNTIDVDSTKEDWDERCYATFPPHELTEREERLYEMINAAKAQVNACIRVVRGERALSIVGKK